MTRLSTLSLELRRFKFAARISLGKFRNNESVHAAFAKHLKVGDCAVDVGANVGHYTKHMSDLVGATGRVLAFEPIPETLALLAANVLKFRHRNVTCLGLALDRQAGERTMLIPTRDGGKRNLYMSAFTSKEDDEAGLKIRAAGYDGLLLGLRPALINVCAEGAELEVLKSMQNCLESDRPILVVENKSTETASWLESLGYDVSTIHGSPSVLAVPRGQDA